ncbi:MAG: PEGA domain-containing protein, partial [Acidobacteria bacterium]|nr:PEGA domain-containing protein [Candidatus Polarisedimenticola svalbardensis]
MLLSAAVAVCGCSTTPDSNALIALQLESQANTPDGCVACGCRLNDQVEPGNEKHWWLVFGLVQAAEGQPSPTLLPASYCGHGSFRAAQADLEQIVGTPHTVADLAIAARKSPGGRVNLEVRMERRRFSGFDSEGQAQYDRATRNRSYHFEKQAEWVLPLLITGEQDTDRLGVHEVLVRMEAVLVGAGAPSSFGSLRVQSDTAGAEVMLNGDFVGRTAEDPPLLLANVPAGEVEVSVRDFSGRTAKSRVTVTEGDIAEDRLDVLNLASTAPAPTGLLALDRNLQGYLEYWRARDGALLVEI